MQPEIIEGFRLSPQQKRVWLLQQGEQNQPYRTQCAIQIEGNLNFQILELALEQIVNQYEILRTTFNYLPGMTIPVQVINDPQTPVIKSHDLLGLESKIQQAKIQDIFRETLRSPFDVEQNILNLSLIALSADKHVLIISLPALCADTVTLKNLMREISLAYTACLQNHEILHAEIQYVDISEWQNELLESESAETGSLHWRKLDMSNLAGCKLPTQKQVKEISGFTPEVLSLTLESDLATNIESLIDKYQTSPSVFFLTCFSILLWRLIGHDIIVGSAFTGRKYEQLEDTFGLLEQYLPMSCRLSEKLQLKEILADIAESSRNTEQWLEYFTWSHLASNNQNIQEQSFLPFQFSFENQSANYNAGDLSFSIYQQYSCLERYNLKLTCTQKEDSFSTDFYYDPGLFSVEDINRLMGQFQTLLRSITSDPELEIAQLNILSEIERQQLLVDFNNTKTSYQKQKCLSELFEEQVERTPENIAVIFEDEQLNYAQLNAQANQLAYHLRQLGVKPGTLVAVYMNRSLEMISAVLGILKAGGAYVPIETSLPQERVKLLLSSLKIDCVVTQTVHVRDLEEIQQEATALQNLICLDNPSESIETSDRLRVWMRSELNNLPQANLPKLATSDDIAYVIFTSGSTGTPKGVVVRHQPVINLIEWVNKTFDINCRDRVLFVTSLSFDLSVYDIFGLLAAGGSIRVASNSDVRDPAALLQILCNESITFWDSAPAALGQLVPFFTTAKSSNSQLRLVFLSGDWIPLTLPDAVKKTFTGVKMISLGGATEATVWSNYYPIEEIQPHWPSIPYGKPIQNAEYYILDSYLNPCPIGVPGDLYIGGEVLSSGYINEPVITAEKFIANPFSNEPKARLYKTGDLARHLPDGNIEFLGRQDNQVKIRGFRIELGEIEAVLSQYPAVQETVVLAKEDNAGDKRLVAYLVVNQEEKPPISELRHFLQAKLPEYMVPANFIFLDTLPLTPNGKVDRRTLLAIADEQTSVREQKFVAPRDSLELQLVQIWEDLLKIRPIGVTDNFFDIGGHSLLAVRLMAQIQQYFHQDLPLATLFQGGTVEHLANILRQQTGSLAWSPLVGMRTTGSKPPFFCVHPVGGNVLCYYDLARYLGDDQPFYGLQAPGLDGEQQPLTTIESMAAFYIEALRTVQPVGPYFLGGWSLGGVIAFEMAQQLEKQGHQVALVALIDSWLTNIDSKPTEVDRATLLTWFAKDLGGRFGKDLGVSVDILKNLEPDEQLNYVLQQAREANVMPQNAGLAQIRRLLSVSIGNFQAERSYQPQAYQKQITLFRAGEELSPTAKDVTVGWNQVAIGVDTHILPANHYTIIQEPHVQFIAEQLRKYF